jgi:kanamycin nucleotidyltransferase
VSRPDRHDANELRLELARRVAERRRLELGPAVVGIACYGSVAHGAAAAGSDLELLIALSGDSPSRDEHFFEDGVMVECSLVSAARLVEEARRVSWSWGIEADAYRHQLALHDPDGFFDRVRAAARAIPDGAFERALGDSWWRAFELRGKLDNALRESDAPRAFHLGWSFAYAAALRIALRERRPYESGRTLWSDVAARGYGMAALLEALTRAEVAAVRPRVESVWVAMRDWSPPDRP